MTVLFLVCAFVLIPAANAQMEQLVIQLGIQAIRMGFVAVGQMRSGRGGVSYDYAGRRDKKADPIWGNHKLFGNSQPPVKTEQTEKDSVTSHKQPVKENSAEETAKDTVDNAVKSVRGSIVEPATKEKTAGEEKSEKNTGSSDAEPEQKEPSSAPFIMMNVPER